MITAEAYLSNPNTPEVPLGSPKKLVELENVTIKQFYGEDGKERSFVLLPYESKFISSVLTVVEFFIGSAQIQ